MKEKHGILLFLTSCMSGCGQMYQGYMKRGISMLLLFFTLLAVAGFLSMPPVAFFLPVVWLYAFFDSYNLRSRIAGGSAPEDEFLFGLSELDSQRMAALLRRRHSIIGWVLVALGVYMLYDILMNQLDFFFGGWFGSYLYSLLRYDLPRLVVTVLVIWLGVWFLRGPKAKPADEDIPPFTPPAPEQGAAQASRQSSPAPASEAAKARVEDVVSEVAAAVNVQEEVRDGEQ